VSIYAANVHTLISLLTARMFSKSVFCSKKRRQHSPTNWKAVTFQAKHRIYIYVVDLTLYIQSSTSQEHATTKTGSVKYDIAVTVSGGRDKQQAKKRQVILCLS
jgi:hypothetical protein